jgi:hypothetical protein
MNPETYLAANSMRQRVVGTRRGLSMASWSVRLFLLHSIRRLCYPMRISTQILSVIGFASCSRLTITIACLLLCCSLTAGRIASAQQRPPATPLIVHDPYFSVWSMSDRLTDQPTRHWTGNEQRLTGIARVDGVAYRYMGDSPRDIPAMRQTSLEVTATHTVYDFEAAGLHLKLTFFTPAFPADLDLLSRPVTYLAWNVWSTDAQKHQVSLLLDADPRIAVNTDNQPVTWGRSQVVGLTVLSVGSRDQQPLNRAGDNLRIDWGYFHLGVPASEHFALTMAARAVQDFVKSGVLPSADDMDMPRAPRESAAHLAVAFTLECSSDQPAMRHILIGYTQNYSIEYLKRELHPYWMRNRETVQRDACPCRGGISFA